MFLHAQHGGNVVGRQGGDHAGNQRVVLQKPDVADLHGDDRGGQRRPKESGESGTHTGHDHDAPCTVGEVESLTHLIAEAAADLQGGTFTAHGSAKEMGGDRGAEDQRRKGSGNALVPRDREKDGVRSFAVIELLIEEDDHCCADGHQEDHPGVLSPQRCGVVDAEREHAGHQSDKRAAEQSVYQEPDHLDEARLDLEQDRFQLVSEVVAVEIHIYPSCTNEFRIVLSEIETDFTQ